MRGHLFSSAPKEETSDFDVLLNESCPSSVCIRCRGYMITRMGTSKEETVLTIIGKSLAGIMLFASLLTVGSSSEEVPQAAASAVPERVSAAVVPAHIAFTSHDHLWLFDGEKEESMPVQVTKDGSVEIVGWSQDGEWLLYLHNPEGGAHGAAGYLWAVNQDGSRSFQVEQKPILEKPKWSPASRQFAYVTGTASGEEREFVVQEIRPDNEAVLVGRSAADFVDFVWMPDGKAILVSTSAASNRPMMLSLREPAGKEIAAYPLADPPKTAEDIYLWAPKGLQVSPDGRLVAYYVLYNSASLSADGVPIHLFDLRNSTNKPVEIGSGLAYPQWLSWSPDSKQLAFIEGGDRLATQNKRLRVVDQAGTVVYETEADQTASFPVWTSKQPYSLYVASGTGVPYPAQYEEQQVMVPGQQIWKREADGTVHTATKGTELTADTFPAPAPDGSQLLFVRLEGPGKGSLYLKKDGNETELIRQVTGSFGYYANYLPEWVQVYWAK